MAIKKLSPKAVAEAAHLIAICSYLIMENIDDVMSEEDAKLVKNEFGVVTRFCETISSSVFDIKEITSTTYIQDMCNKVNTVIRKNAKFIPGK
jgi:hypothetical protein